MAESSSVESKMYTASYTRHVLAILPLVVAAPRRLPEQEEGNGGPSKLRPVVKSLAT